MTVDQVTQRNASAAEELASTAEELAAQAEALREMMGFFQISDLAGTNPPRPAAKSNGVAPHHPRTNGPSWPRPNGLPPPGDDAEFARF
jgi:methyl-accepting chemotaxis protein